MAHHPFDTFTERARKVLTLAQEEARRFNHNYIGTEHLLLGLVREGDGVAARVLSNMGVQLSKVRSAVELIVGHSRSTIAGPIGLTPRSRKVIELAVDEARRLNCHYIGTEHLLLGMVREGEGVAADVLESLGVNLEQARRQVMQVVSQSATYQAGQRASATSDAVADQESSTYAELVRIQRELEEAVRSQQFELALELRDQERKLRERLESADERAASHVREWTPPPRSPRSGPVVPLRPEPRGGAGDGETEFGPFTEPARQVFALAVSEASRLGHNYVGTEHLLLGLIRAPAGNALRLLASLGAELPKIRSAVEFMIDGGRASGGEIVLTPRTKKVLRLAVAEARQFGADAVGTEHLLLGLVAEGEGIAWGVLESLGVRVERLRERVITGLELGANQSTGETGKPGDNGEGGGAESA